MTPIEQQAREWAEKNVVYNNDSSAIQQLTDAYLTGFEARGEWISVTGRLPESSSDNPPVYELYLDFPGNKDFKPCEQIVLNHKMGGIYWEYKVSDCQGERSYTEDFFSKYPHLFRRVLPSPPNKEI